MLENQGEAFGMTLGKRKPIFDIKVSAEKASPFTKISQNELALQLYNAGMFNPEMKGQAILALSMLDFEGKNAIIAKISSEGTVLCRRLLSQNITEKRK